MAAACTDDGKGDGGGGGGGGNILVTGGAGFVLSNVIHAWLTTDAKAHAVAFDLERAWDDAAKAFLQPMADAGRMHFFEGSVSDVSDWERLKATFPKGYFKYVLSGAALTPTAAEEASDGGAARILNVNLFGALHALEFTRQWAAENYRFIFVSSGALFRHPGLVCPAGENEAIPSSMEMYTLSKWTGEQLVARYRDLYNMDALCIRFASVYGRMDRDTGARNRHNAPYWVCKQAVASKPVVVVGDIESPGGDYLSAVDLSQCVVTMLRSPQTPKRGVYFIGLGRAVSHRELLEAVYMCVTPSQSIDELIEKKAIVFASKDGAVGVNDGGNVHLEALSPSHPLCRGFSSTTDISPLKGMQYSLTLLLHVRISAHIYSLLSSRV